MLVYYIKILVGFFLSFFITYYLVPFVIALAKRLRILDVPDGIVKRHKEPTPYLGGIAVYIGFIASLGFIFPFQNQMLLFFIGITLLLFIGLVDDLVALKPLQKLLGQVIAAFCFMKSGIFLKTDFLLNHYIFIPLSFLWILIVINAFNLIDVMDGLATLVALCATGSFLIIGILLQDYYISLLMSSFLGALLGFFFYNKPTAKIYLGDTGSLFIGGVLAIIPFVFNWGLYTPHGFFAPAIILAIPLLEVAGLIIIRTKKGIPFHKASPDHFCLYLLRAGWSKQSILLYTAILSFFLGIISIFYVSNLISPKIVAFLGSGFLFNWVLLFTQQNNKR